MDKQMDKDSVLEMHSVVYCTQSKHDWVFNTVTHYHSHNAQTQIQKIHHIKTNLL